jgi:hypothetical protein
MSCEKISLCFSQVHSEEDRRNPALVPAQGESKIVIPPEGPGVGKTIFGEIVKVDPTGRDLINAFVNGLKTISGQPVGGPFIKIFSGPISHDPELADADGVGKNAHLSSLRQD